MVTGLLFWSFTVAVKDTGVPTITLVEDKLKVVVVGVLDAEAIAGTIQANKHIAARARARDSIGTTKSIHFILRCPCSKFQDGDSLIGATSFR